MDEGFARTLALVELGLVLPTVLALSWVAAPYGRHRREGFGPSLPVKISWLLMEAPAVVAFAWGFVAAGASTAPAALLLLVAWQTHYVHRSFVYPLRIAGGQGRTSPLLITALGASFNSLNGLANGFAAGAKVGFGQPLLFALGAVLFVAGLGINIHHDNLLLRLRRERVGADYQVPQGGLFRLVSCPNYLGELIEWLGFLAMSQSLASLAFCLYAAANLGPRALSHHRWYKAHFPDYPSRRRALLPFLL